MRSETGKRKNWCGSVTLIRLSWWGVKQQWRPTDPLALRVPLIRLPYEEWNLRLRRTKAAREGCYINLITLWGVKHFRPHTSPSSAQVAVIWFLLWGVKLRLGPNLNLTDRVAIIWFLLWGVKPASASRIFFGSDGHSNPIPSMRSETGVWGCVVGYHVSHSNSIPSMRSETGRAGTWRQDPHSRSNPISFMRSETDEQLKAMDRLTASH